MSTKKGAPKGGAEEQNALRFFSIMRDREKSVAVCILIKSEIKTNTHHKAKLGAYLYFCITDHIVVQQNQNIIKPQNKSKNAK